MQFRVWLCGLIYPDYRKELADYKDRVSDLHAQCELYRVGRPLLPEERVDLERIVKEHTRLVQEQNTITVFIRDNIPGMLKGEFAGMSFSQMVIHLIRKGM